MFEDQKNRLLAALDQAHASYCQATESDWPGLHFHLASLEAAAKGDFGSFAERSYALLVAWGMQRRGGGPIMREFGAYKESLRVVWPEAIQLRDATPDGLGQGEWNSLENIFRGIDVMETRPKIVGNSKVMAHLLPGLVPPVDGRYTLGFLFPEEDVPKGLDKGWQRLRQVVESFFHPLCRADAFQARVSGWLNSPAFRWDTSALKIADNLVLEFFRCAGCRSSDKIKYYPGVRKYLCKSCAQGSNASLVASVGGRAAAGSNK
jgi:hypothetical protein